MYTTIFEPRAGGHNGYMGRRAFRYTNLTLFQTGLRSEFKPSLGLLIAGISVLLSLLAGLCLFERIVQRPCCLFVLLPCLLPLKAFFVARVVLGNAPHPSDKPKLQRLPCFVIHLVIIIQRVISCEELSTSLPPSLLILLNRAFHFPNKQKYPACLFPRPCRIRTPFRCLLPMLLCRLPTTTISLARLRLPTITTTMDVLVVSFLLVPALRPLP